MPERQKKGERAILVSPLFRQSTFAHLSSDPEEFSELALSAGVSIVDHITVQRDRPDPKYFIGKGRVEVLQAQVQAHDVDVVIFNTTLLPGQERNLSHFLACRVLDRMRLILDIFAQRARSFEGKLQVELAQLTHQASRLIGGQTQLDRQKGGIGLRGPGETQLETDRRLIRDKMRHLKVRLAKLQQQRAQSRQARKKADVLNLSLVGYTNAGKSSLFNQLAGTQVWAADQLFATLDPTLRTVNMGKLGQVVLADTVGFIQHLPPDLIEAFKATLEETQNADLLLHVIDVSHPAWRTQVTEVESVLEQLSALKLPRLKIYNKIDLLPGGEAKPRLVYNEVGEIEAVFISSKTKAGLDLLRDAVAERLKAHLVEGKLLFPVGLDTALLQTALYAEGAVLSHDFHESGQDQMLIQMRKHRWMALCQRFPDVNDYFHPAVEKTAFKPHQETKS